jgi:hypothetical protein
MVANDKAYPANKKAYLPHSSFRRFGKNIRQQSQREIPDTDIPSTTDRDTVATEIVFIKKKAVSADKEIRMPRNADHMG